MCLFSIEGVKLCLETLLKKGNVLKSTTAYNPNIGTCANTKLLKYAP